MTVFLQISAALGGVTFLSGLITALVLWRRSKAEVKKLNVDAAAVLTDSAMKVLQNVREEAEGLRKELRATRDELAGVRGQLRTVEALLRDNGIPVPTFDFPPYRNGVV